jgi:hypothetical protein
MVKPTVLAAKQSPFFPSFWNAAVTACTRKDHRAPVPVVAAIVAPPRRFMDHVHGCLMA